MLRTMNSLLFYAVFAFISVSVLQNAMALQCRNCLSSKSWAECEKMGGIVDCNTTIVNENHKNFEKDNPTLTQGNGTDFKCFRMEAVVLNENKTDTGLRGYAQGCTFLSTDFCQGWVSTLNITNCGTCNVDNCDQNLPTSAPGATTTMAPGSNTTTTPAPTNSTTTKKPTNGANILSISSFASLSFLSVLLILAAR